MIRAKLWPPQKFLVRVQRGRAQRFTQIALSYTILSFIGLPLYELISIINLKRSQLTKIVSSKKRVIDISRGHGISHT